MWVEEYRCGCSAESENRKELLGYCVKHGDIKIRRYKIIDDSDWCDGKDNNNVVKP